MTTIPDRDSLELIGAIMSANAAQAAFTTNALIDSWETRALTAEVILDLARATIEDLFDGPYMPTPDAVLRALWPPSGKVDHHVELRRRKREAVQ